MVGADLSELVGIVLLGLFEVALSEQAALPPEQRRYMLLIDEFQMCRGASYQVRKYVGFCPRHVVAGLPEPAGAHPASNGAGQYRPPVCLPYGRGGCTDPA